ncbi:MAG: M3 family metallopeptidase [Xanthomonadales bacterium]|nr:M3 family metallopeptidase [Xanthomonadales bacterium]NNL95164.1 M3 family metallopeptidase [Xanthomonadales bacterium]
MKHTESKGLRWGLLALLGTSLLMTACSQEQGETTVQAESAGSDVASSDTVDNPFMHEWDTPFGIPPFEKIRDEHYKPAFDAGIEELRAEIAAIRNNPEPPTFENTIVALEQAGSAVSRVMDVFGNVTNTDTNDALQALEVELYPLLTREVDAIVLDDAIYQRVKAVYEQRDSLGLDEQDARLLELAHRDFVRSGAAMDEVAKARMKEINARMSELTTRFGQNLLAETKNFELVITDESDLSGLPAALVSAGKSAAKAKGRDDAWIFGLNRSVYEAFMTFADNRELRKQLFDGYRSRAAKGGANDSRDLITEIAKLRAEAAELRGYRSHAEFQLETRMAKTPEGAEEFLVKVWEPGLARAKEEKTEMQAIVEEEGHDFIIEGHDWWYYAEKLRQKKYAIDDSEVKPFFELENVKDGAFHVAEKLFGVTFEPLTDVPLWNPQVLPYNVLDENGDHLGVFMIDYYARDSKRGGAWKSNYRDASSVNQEVVRPIVTNNLNLMTPGEGEPTLMSFGEVTTLFHEFGHALHGLMTTQRYARFSGTTGPRDYTEFPAQFMEHYAAEPEVLAIYAKHYETGETIPDSLVEKVRNARVHNQGFKTTEYIAASLLDLKWHDLSANEAANVEDAREFEVETLEAYGKIDEIEPRYRSPYFSHIFAGGYSAGYYAYLWSEILDSDGFDAFKETGNIFNPELAQRLKENVYQAGGREEADVLYRKFRGKDPSIVPLLRNRGFPTGGSE